MSKKSSGHTVHDFNDYMYFHLVQLNDIDAQLNPSFEWFVDEDADEVEISVPHTEDRRKSFKKQDSTMSQNLSMLVYSSWTGSKGFRGYRDRLGNALHHRYCMCKFVLLCFLNWYWKKISSKDWISHGSELFLFGLGWVFKKN